MIVSRFDNTDNTTTLSAFALDIIHYVASQSLETIELGKYPVREMELEDAHFIVMEYETQEKSLSGPEFHRFYSDVQFLLIGEEKCGWAILSDEQLEQYAKHYNYNPMRDICFVEPTPIHLNYFNMQLGEFYVFPPNTLHMPSLNVESSSTVRKVVIKIKTSLLSCSNEAH
jgi:YhcH/YjgK/YiaL family protein